MCIYIKKKENIFYYKKSLKNKKASIKIQKQAKQNGRKQF